LNDSLQLIASGMGLLWWLDYFDISADTSWVVFKESFRLLTAGIELVFVGVLGDVSLSYPVVPFVLLA